MYTVIVADDEEEIRRGIIENVKWETLGFQLVGEASNGMEALELVEKLEPDLLLTDIKMPFLSGIELAREVREVRPMVQIAFLSGFDDFTYAQQAIQYNIINYILKPISVHELEEELSKIKEQIDQKFKRFAAAEKVKQQAGKSEFMLSLLLDNGLEEASLESRQELMETAVDCGLLTTSDSEAFKYSVMITSIFDGGVNHTTRASVNAVDMILEKYVHHVSCYLSGRVVSIIAATPSQTQKYLHILVDEIAQSVQRIMKLKCMVGISRSTQSLMNCRKCYLEAMNALSYSRQNEDNIHFIADEERVELVNQEMIRTTVDTLEDLLRGGSQEELQAFLDEFSEQIAMGKIAPSLADFLIAQMGAAIFRVVYAVGGDSSMEWLHEHFHLNSHQNMVGQVLESYEQYQTFCLAAKEMLSRQRKKSGEILCDKALEIIRTRFEDADVSMVAISNEISVSPNYLSALIKKTTGKTFVELLTARRVEKAKELLLCTSMKIREISAKCGYSDQHYFSYSFKKATGMSPNQCRRDSE